jgi:hypothetical protein
MSERDLKITGSDAKPVDSNVSDIKLIDKDVIEFTFVKNAEGVKHTMVIGLKHILPEDILWRREHNSVPAMICFQKNNSCDCPFNCIPRLASRVFFLFENFPDLVQIIVIFKRDEKPLKRRQPSKDKLIGMGEGFEVKTVVPRVFALHIDKDFSLRMIRSNYDGLVVATKDAPLETMKVPPSFWTV